MCHFIISVAWCYIPSSGEYLVISAPRCQIPLSATYDFKSVSLWQTALPGLYNHIYHLLFQLPISGMNHVFVTDVCVYHFFFCLSWITALSCIYRFFFLSDVCHIICFQKTYRFDGYIISPVARFLCLFVIYISLPREFHIIYAFILHSSLSGVYHIICLRMTDIRLVYTSSVLSPDYKCLHLVQCYK